MLMLFKMSVSFDYSSFFHISLLFFCIANTFTLSYSAPSENCRSFGDQLGTCITIRRCPSALNLIAAEEGYVTGENVRRLQKITCGFQGDDPKVCCPVNGRTETDVIEENSLKTHRNFASIPSQSQCGEQKIKIADRIIGGRVPPIGSFPWLVRVGYRTSKGIEFYCGGSIINKRYVLTAAHCVVGDQPASVRLGEHKISEDPDCSESSGCSYVEDYKIIKVISHQNYNTATKKHDIALLKLDRDISFSNFIQPVCLPFVKEYSISNFPDLENSDSSAIVAGWGRTKYDIAEESEFLQYVTVPLMTNKRCSEIYSGKTKISETQMCAGGRANKDSCDGDSGGPLILGLMDNKYQIQRFSQIAIVSYGPTKCGTIGLPGIYTRVSEYLKWVLDNIGS